MKIKYEDLDKLIDIIKEAKDRLKPGEFYEVKNNKLNIISTPPFDLNNWYIITNLSNNDIIVEWFEKLVGNKIDESIGNSMGFKNGKKKGLMNFVDPKEKWTNCTEITFNQFKKYILKQ